MYKKSSSKKGASLKKIYPKGSIKKGAKSVADPSRYGNKNSNKKVSVVSGLKDLA